MVEVVSMTKSARRRARQRRDFMTLMGGAAMANALILIMILFAVMYERLDLLMF